MTGRRAKGRKDNAFGIIVDFAEAVDTIVERLTGKPISTLLKEFEQQPRELPGREQVAVQQSDMPLADAYAILGLKPNTSFDEVKKRYRDLARLFHPDKPGGYTEAMRLLNNAYEKVIKEKGK